MGLGWVGNDIGIPDIPLACVGMWGSGSDSTCSDVVVVLMGYVVCGSSGSKTFARCIASNKAAGNVSKTISESLSSAKKTRRPRVSFMNCS